MVLASLFKLNPTLASEGRWTSVNGMEFRVRHWTYGPFQQRMNELTFELLKDDANLDDDGQLASEHQSWAIREAMAEELVPEWRKIDHYARDDDGNVVTDANGKPVIEVWEPTLDARREFLQDPGWRHITEKLAAYARKDALYSEEIAARAAGNSSGS